MKLQLGSTFAPRGKGQGFNGLAAVLLIALIAVGDVTAAERPPNVVLILADDLGYGDLGCYGQTIIKTPNLDRMASGGIRFSQFYAGSTVCAPSRCVLMTGLHTGHCRIRGNGGPPGVGTLRHEDVTLAELMREAGYATACCGKWGLGEANPALAREGLPNDQGFDYFYGYLNHTHAHNYYPEFLWRNMERVPLQNIVEKLNPGSPGGYATKKVEYSPDLVTDEAFQFVREHGDEPFFLYWAVTIPHANNEARRATSDGQEVPDYGPYADEPWPNPDKGQAAMITRMDADVGRLFKLFDELDIADKTLVLFTSDNGPHHEGGQDLDRFDPNGPLRGIKRDLYEGGIRVPLIAWWPKKIAAGVVSDHVSYHGDVFATLAEAIDQTATSATDSISLMPTLRGDADSQKQHDYLYWEFYEQGGKQAVRWQDWKAVRMPMHTGRTELYNLASDIGETDDVASDHPDIVARLEALMDQGHAPDAMWKPRGKPANNNKRYP